MSESTEERLSALVEKIRRGVNEPNNYTLFQSVVTEFLTQSGLTPRELAGKFGCTATTVQMWMDGAAMPHEKLRPSIYQYLHTVLTTGDR